MTQATEVQLRSHYRPGDWGWVIERHGALYAAEQGWGERFEALVARLVAEFARAYDPARDHFWIAERGEERLGSVFLARETETACRLRFFLVDPEARGMGIGCRLVEACINRAHDVGYDRMVLATHHVLLPARRIYAAAGFHLVSALPDPDFGGDLEHWELDLR